MLAIDTNVFVPLLTGDHLQQSPKAKELFERETVFVALCFHGRQLSFKEFFYFAVDFAIKRTPLSGGVFY